MKTNTTSSFYPIMVGFFFVTLTLSACGGNSTDSSDTSSEVRGDTVYIERPTEPGPAEEPSTPKFAQLDQFPTSSRQRVPYQNSDESDCWDHLFRYPLDDGSVLLDSLKCSGYYQQNTYYLVDESNNVQMVHIKYLENYVDYDTEELFYVILEKIIDFQEPQPTIIARRDTFLRKTFGTSVKYDNNYAGAPWLVINAKGDDFVLGKKIDYDGEWYEVTKNVLKDSLFRLRVLPRPIPIQFNGQIGVGIRGEFRSMAEEAIQEIVPDIKIKLQKNKDPFLRINKPFLSESEPAEEFEQAYWQKRYNELVK